MKKNVKNLSGGELQKVAVAALLLPELTSHALDQPSAFLILKIEQPLPNFCTAL